MLDSQRQLAFWWPLWLLAVGARPFGAAAVFVLHRLGLLAGFRAAANRSDMRAGVANWLGVVDNWCGVGAPDLALGSSLHLIGHQLWHCCTRTPQGNEHRGANMLSFTDHWYNRVAQDAAGVKLGTMVLAEETPITDPVLGTMTGRTLLAMLETYPTHITPAPQLAALVYAATGESAAMRPYFPLLGTLDEAQSARFETQTIAATKRLDLALFEEDGHGGVRAGAVPRDAAYLVAGHIVEVFFFRPDILEHLLAAQARIWLYTNAQAYRAHGGISGGCYNPSIGGIQLVVSRLYEGFGSSTPGPAPLLHELGHLLDHFDAVHDQQGPATGLYPGLRHADGLLFTPQARTHFARGKALELERYTRRRAGVAGANEPLPIGHPYVFQNDGEFLAGYLEMFFRNPHAFAAQNAELYAGYCSLFRQDPRDALAEDFPYYVEDNRRFYLESGEQPWPTKVTLPQDSL